LTDAHIVARAREKSTAKAVDMTLCVPQSLDNANALPTCQQQEQKTQTAA